MRQASTLAALVIVALATQARGVTSFFSLDSSFSPSAQLVRFTSDPSDMSLGLVGSSPSLSSVHTAAMDLSLDGRLFVAPYGKTVYELNPNTGQVLGSLGVDDTYPVEGLAADEAGRIYVSVGDGGRIKRVDFDQQTISTLLSSSPSDIDDLDFDDHGNLIAVGNATSETNDLFLIPQDGSQPQFITTLYPPTNTGGTMTFSPAENAFYFLRCIAAGEGTLWRLQWSGGQPAGDPEFVKNIGPGHYAGLAAIPDPSTAFLLLMGVFALRRRRQTRREQSPVR